MRNLQRCCRVVGYAAVALMGAAAGVAGATVTGNNYFNFGYPVYAFNVDVWNDSSNDWVLWDLMETGGATFDEGQPLDYWNYPKEIPYDDTTYQENNEFGFYFSPTFCLYLSSHKHGELGSFTIANPSGCFNDDP